MSPSVKGSNDLFMLRASVFTIILFFGFSIGCYYSSSLLERKNHSIDFPNQIKRRLVSPRAASFSNVYTNTSIDDADIVCNEYLEKFYDGYTDAKDYCDGLSNAYQAADCERVTKVEPNSILFSRTLQLLSETENKTELVNPSMFPSTFPTRYPSSPPTVKLLDDDFEEWSCCSSIQKYYGDYCHGWAEVSDSRVLFFFLTLILCVFVKAIIRHYEIRNLPESAACILVGGIVAGITTLLPGDLYEQNVDDESFNEKVLLVFLLPPIVFSASLHINKKAFSTHVIPIMLYASIGTLISAFLVGFMIHLLSSANGVETIPILESLIFGSLISSVDPVVILNILENVGISEDDPLYVILFGESLLNDALAIVLFDTMTGLLKDGADELFSTTQAWAMVFEFYVVILGSITVAVFFAACSNIFFWYLKEKQSSSIEVLAFFLWAFIPYYVCDLLKLSGIVALVVVGFIMDIFVIGLPSEISGGNIDSYRAPDFIEEEPLHEETRMQRENGSSMRRLAEEEIINEEREERQRNGIIQTPFELLGGPLTENSSVYNIAIHMFSTDGQLSREAKEHVGFLAEVLSSLAETSIFAYLGAFLFREKFMLNWGINFIAVFACVSSRGVMVMVLSFLNNFLEHIGCGNKIRGGLRRCQRILFLDNMDVDADTSILPILGSSSSYIDFKMQGALIFGGLRGAVSVALVQSLPLYNVVTKTGTQYKGSLKAMTYSCIIFTVFGFGGLSHRVLGLLGFLPNASRKTRTDSTLTPLITDIE